VAEKLEGKIGQSFEEHLTQNIEDLYRYASILVREPSDAQDLVSETLLKALERKEQFRWDSSLRTWLHRILYHLAIDRTRHSSHEAFLDDDRGFSKDIDELWRESSYSVDPELVAMRAETAEELRDALLHVPMKERSVVLLHDREGWSLAEIAEMLHIGLPAAKQRLRRGRMSLVTALAQGAQRRLANKEVVMECWEARQKVSDFIDGLLPDSVARALREHLSECATCPPLYQALVRTKAAMGGLHDPNSVIPPELAGKLRKLLKGSAPEKSSAS